MFLNIKKTGYWKCTNSGVYKNNKKGIHRMPFLKKIFDVHY
jgi:hypothetical protein